MKIVRVLFFSLAHRPKDHRPNSCILVDWAWFTTAKWGLIMNQVVRKSHKSPQGKNAIPPRAYCRGIPGRTVVGFRGV